MNLTELATETGVILGALTGIASLVYWAIRAKFKDEFCSKNECDKKHLSLDDSLLSYRKDIADDIREIKDIVIRIETRFFDWISKQQ